MATRRSPSFEKKGHARCARCPLWKGTRGTCWEKVFCSFLRRKHGGKVCCGSVHQGPCSTREFGQPMETLWWRLWSAFAVFLWLEQELGGEAEGLGFGGNTTYIIFIVVNVLNDTPQTQPTCIDQDVKPIEHLSMMIVTVVNVLNDTSQIQPTCIDQYVKPIKHFAMLQWNS